MACYLAIKRKHPFGTKRHRLDSILKGIPSGLNEIKNDKLKDLLSWMLSLRPEDRLSSDEALIRPFLMSYDDTFEFYVKLETYSQLKQMISCQVSFNN